jgi:phosphosulfolactate synthase (CoM biosynthesis protein A)
MRGLRQFISNKCAEKVDMTARIACREEGWAENLLTNLRLDHVRILLQKIDLFKNIFSA